MRTVHVYMVQQTNSTNIQLFINRQSALKRLVTAADYRVTDTSLVGGNMLNFYRL